MTTHWMNQDTLESIQHEIPENTYLWLTKPNNLTDTLKQTGVTFSLSVLSQRLGQPYEDERDTLNTSRALIRKVILEGNHQPMIFARVIIPEPTYRQYQQTFDKLGNAPIGNALLYNNEHVSRSVFSYQKLSEQEDLFQELKSYLPLAPTHDYWARRSKFDFHQAAESRWCKGERVVTDALLITEVFLESIPFYPAAAIPGHL